jgi:hypothetical protein
MHQKLTKHERFCKQTNQLPIKSHDELKDNSIISLHVQIKLEKCHFVLKVCAASGGQKWAEERMLKA